jgi:hypothetical protein
MIAARITTADFFTQPSLAFGGAWTQLCEKKRLEFEYIQGRFQPAAPEQNFIFDSFFAFLPVLRWPAIALADAANPRSASGVTHEGMTEILWVIIPANVVLSGYCSGILRLPRRICSILNAECAGSCLAPGPERPTESVAGRTDATPGAKRSSP